MNSADQKSKRVKSTVYLFIYLGLKWGSKSPKKQ